MDKVIFGERAPVERNCRTPVRNSSRAFNHQYPTGPAGVQTAKDG